MRGRARPAGPPGGRPRAGAHSASGCGAAAGVAVWSSGLDGRLGLVERDVLESRRTRGCDRGPSARGSGSPGRRPALPSRPGRGPAATLSSVRAAIASISSSRSSSSTLISSASAIFARMKNSLRRPEGRLVGIGPDLGLAGPDLVVGEALLPQLHDQPAGWCSSPGGRPGRGAGRTASRRSGRRGPGGGWPAAAGSRAAAPGPRGRRREARRGCRSRSS